MSDKALRTSDATRDLLEATRVYAVESRLKSWWCVGSTFLALGTLLVVAALPLWWPLRVGAALAGGLLFVRAFILFHDFQHGALLRGSKCAQALFYAYGLIALTPARHWRRSHNFHHANVGKPIPSEAGLFSLLTSDIGSFSLMTTDMWRRASTWQRLRYRVIRHPLTIVFAYITIFLVSLCLAPLLQNPRKNWDNALSIIAHASLVAALWVFAGLPALLFGLVVPFAIAAALGAYLFFAQHNFKGMRIVPTEEWTHYRGALESSSYMRLGPIMSWFTGNIGYHHVHHLNALIPFYRLPEAMAALPGLQQPIVTSLRLRDVLACLRLNLWDEQKQQLVSYQEVASQAA
jgi:acyl-lipid omega-6 desaturase (Delta-12 desaturase)